MNKRFLICSLCACLYLTLAAKNKKEKQQYDANWESIRSGYKHAEWFQDAKFGIFVIWGVYSVPAIGNEWYSQHMYSDRTLLASGINTFKYHKETYGDQSEFGYKDFIPMFKMENYDADAWADLFVRSGAKYVVPVADFCDGFAMHKSKTTPWNVVDMGPKKDVMRMLEKSVRARNLKFGVSSHFALNRYFYPKDKKFDTMNPEYVDLYWRNSKDPKNPVDQETLDRWWNRTTEVIDEYEPDLLYFDFGIDHEGFEPVRAPMLAYYYNKGLEWEKDLVFNGKNMNKISHVNGVFKHDRSVKSFPEDLIILDLERGRMAEIQENPWQTDTSVGIQSWSYIINERYKSSSYLIDELIDIVSKNGNLLLAIGPKADGTIDPQSTKILEAMGLWLERNGEAIFGTRPWKIHGEGPTKVAAGNHSEHNNVENVAEDIRFTTKGERLYAISLAWPESGTFMIKSLAKGNEFESREIDTVEFISGGKVEWEQTKHGLYIKTLDGKPCEAAYAFRIRFKN